MGAELVDAAVSHDLVAEPAGRERRRDLALLAFPIICLLALFARIMLHPLQRDEQFYVPAGVLFSFSGLYRDLNFSHFPNLPLLLDFIYGLSGSDHYLLVGRFLIFAAWIGASVALYQFGRFYAKSRLLIMLMMALLMLNPALLGSAGMAVTNNFIATPFLIGGVLAFLVAIDRPSPNIAMVMLGGFLLAVGVGFKANYIVLLPLFGLAALLLPPWLPVMKRLGSVAAPLFVGGAIGGLPALAFFGSDPMGFIAHCFSFHRGPQIAFWLAQPGGADSIAMGLRDKLLLANQSWLAGTNLVLIATVMILAITGVLHRDKTARPFLDWRVILLASATAICALVSFLPTPAFPQYYSTPIVFGILTMCLQHHALGEAARNAMRPVYLAGIALAFICGGAILFSSISGLIRPNKWTGLVVHRDAESFGPKVRRASPGGRLATLYPVHALEANLPVYPHLALGPFIYRASAYIPAGERPYFRYLASPKDIDRTLQQEPPAGILINDRDELNSPLIQFALRNGYRKIELELRQTNDVDEPLLFLRRPVVSSGPVKDASTRLR